MPIRTKTKYSRRSSFERSPLREKPTRIFTQPVITHNVFVHGREHSLGWGRGTFRL